MAEKTAEDITNDFLRHLDAGDYTIQDEPDLETRIWQHREGYAPIKRNLMSALEDYTENTNQCYKMEDNQPDTERARRFILHENAIRCAILIRRARLENMILENPSFKSQVEEKNREIERLRELNSKLCVENAHLKKQVKALHETLAKFSPVRKQSNEGNEHP